MHNTEMMIKNVRKALIICSGYLFGSKISNFSGKFIWHCNHFDGNFVWY